MKSFLAVSAILLTTSIAHSATMLHTSNHNTPEDYALISTPVHIEVARKIASEKESIHASAHEIHMLEQKLEKQRKYYEARIQYLQNELNKSQSKVVDNAITYQKREKRIKKELKAETATHQMEMFAKNKQILEYKTMMDKLASHDGVKNLILANTELTLQVRDMNERLAGSKLMDKLDKADSKGTIAVQEFKAPEAKGRLPASAAE